MDTSAGQLLGDSVIGPTVTSKAFGHTDDFLFTWVPHQHLACRVGRIENETLRDRTGAFTSSDLLLQNFVDALRDLFPLQLRDGGQDGQDRATHWSVGVDLLSNLHQVLSPTDKDVFDEHDEIADTTRHSIES
jgi:hypothetical protein